MIAKLWIIFQKELLDNLRDYRSWITGLFWALFGPLILGGLTGLAAIVFAFYTNSVSPSSHGSFFELYGIAAAVLGGCSLRGGEGSILGILLGTTLLQVLQNLVNLLGIPSSLNFAVMGAVVLVGVLADNWLQRRGERRRVRSARERDTA